MNKYIKKTIIISLLFLIFSNCTNIFAMRVDQDVEGGLSANDLVVGETYALYYYVPYLKFNGKEIQGSLTKKCNCNNYAYSYFEIGVFNLPYQTSSPYTFSKGEEVTITHESLSSSTYESSLSNTLSISNQLKSSVTANIDIFDIGLSSVTSIKNQLVKTIGNSTTFSSKSTITRTHKIEEDSVYYIQRRANFNMYLIYSYQKVSGGYKYIGEKTWYQYISDTGETLAKYASLDNGTLRYSSPILNPTHYYI